MSTPIRVLVAEDEPATAHLLRAALRRGGYACTVVGDGARALERLRQGGVDVLLTDWLMPGLNGIDLIREVRRHVRPPPLVVMVTSIDTDAGRSVAMMAGADEFIAKPVSADRLLRVVEQGLRRMAPPQNRSRPPSPAAEAGAVMPPHVAVCLAASTGGPAALLTVLRDLRAPEDAVVYVVQHGPEWLLRQLAARVARETGRRTHYVDRGMRARPKEIYVAPSGHDLSVVARSDGDVQLDLVSTGTHAAPTADPLLTSAAVAYGQFCVGAVLTGLGADGARGARDVERAGGVVLVQDPADAVAPGMPNATIETGVAREVEPTDRLGGRLRHHARALAQTLREARPGA